jgi:outer membrane protein assembly factor BamB
MCRSSQRMQLDRLVGHGFIAGFHHIMKTDRLLGLAISLLSLSCAVATSAAPAWPQFRGPGGLSAASEGRPPVHFGPSSNVLWKTSLPSGNSSPCIWGDRIFITGYEKPKLQTFCLDRGTGKILWQKAAPAAQIEPAHRISSPACPTPATDGEHVYV